MGHKLLLIEDDTNLGTSLKKFLEREGLIVDWAPSLKEARTQIKNPHDLVILDWMLPDGQGIDFLKEMRTAGLHLPVIMLTARTDLIDKIIGLETGANDYITKPFEPRELLARIRVQLRPIVDGGRAKLNEKETRIERGPLVIDSFSRKAFMKEVEVELTKMEFDLLKLLAETPNRAFSREEILNKVWGYEHFPTTRTVDTHVLQLRQKFQNDLIETVRGIGYRFKLPD